MFEVAVLIQFSKSSVSSLGTGRDDVPGSFLCHGDEASEQHACMNGHLPTATQSGIRKAYLVYANNMQSCQIRSAILRRYQNG